MTIFGMRSPDGIRSVGHYYVAGAGSVDVDGWGVRLEFKRVEAGQWIGRLFVDPRTTGIRSATSARRARGSAKPDPRAGRGHARPDDVDSDRDSGDRNARVRSLQAEQRLRPAQRDAVRTPGSMRGSTCRSIRRCRSGSEAPSGKCWSASGTCSAIQTTRHRSTTSCSSSARRSASSADSWFVSDRGCSPEALLRCGAPGGRVAIALVLRGVEPAGHFFPRKLRSKFLGRSSTSLEAVSSRSGVVGKKPVHSIFTVMNRRRDRGTRIAT